MRGVDDRGEVGRTKATAVPQAEVFSVCKVVAVLMGGVGISRFRPTCRLDAGQRKHLCLLWLPERRTSPALGRTTQCPGKS